MNELTDTKTRGSEDAPRQIEATRGVAVRDFLIFQLKLVMDGLKDVVLFQISIAAIVLDLLRGAGRKPRLFYSVLRYSERFDLWLNLNGALEELEKGELNDDGLFGASKAGSDTLLGKLEQMVRGGDVPRGMRQEERVGEEGTRPGGKRSAADAEEGVEAEEGSGEEEAAGEKEGGASGAERQVVGTGG